MKTVRVRVIRSHILGANRFAEVGDILDLPEGTAIERMHSGTVELAPPEPAPEAPAPPAAPAEPDAPQEPAEEAGDEPAESGTPKTTRGPRAGKEKA